MRTALMMADDDGDDQDRPVTPPDLQVYRREREDARRAEVMSLVMAGLSYEQIGQRLEVSREAVGEIVTRALQDRPAAAVEEMRAVENARLDRAQAAIWSKVLDGDQRAISTFLSISSRRARMNGMDAPIQIDVSARVRVEMEQALDELKEVVLGEVVHRGLDDSEEYPGLGTGREDWSG
jgi:transposase